MDICVDRGGTFTDVFVRSASGRVSVSKLLSVNPGQYADAPTQAIRRLIDPESKSNALLKPNGQVRALRMATTVSTNALLERTGANVALVVSRGFHDYLEIGDQTRTDIFDLKTSRAPVLYSTVVEADERVQLFAKERHHAWQSEGYHAEGGVQGRSDSSENSEKGSGVEQVGGQVSHCSDKGATSQEGKTGHVQELAELQAAIANESTALAGFLSQWTLTPSNTDCSPCKLPKQEFRVPYEQFYARDSAQKVDTSKFSRPMQRLAEYLRKLAAVQPQECLRFGSGDCVRVLRRPCFDALYRQLKHVFDAGVRAVAVCLMHASIYPFHERFVGIIAHMIGFDYVVLSSETLNQSRYIARGQSAVVDAYLSPVLKRYMRNFLRGFEMGSFRGQKPAGPSDTDTPDNWTSLTSLKFMKSDGALTSMAQFNGLQALLSGPAAGVVGCAKSTPPLLQWVAQVMIEAELPLPSLLGFFAGSGSAEEAKDGANDGDQQELFATVPMIGFDMGGTSTDVSRLVCRFKPPTDPRKRANPTDFSFSCEYEYTDATRIDEVPVCAPQIQIKTVAAGGGSMLTVHGGRLLQVGPQSCGAFPGPVCYRNTGGRLAVTDANVVTGRLCQAHFPKIFGPDGNQGLDAEASWAAFRRLAAQCSIGADVQGPSERKSGVGDGDAQSSVLSTPSDDHDCSADDETVKSLDACALAYGFIQVANVAMNRPIRALTQGRGFHLNRHVLVVFGGAGGQHGCGMASALGVRLVVVHRFASVLSAVGLSMADTETEHRVPTSLQVARRLKTSQKTITTTTTTTSTSTSTSTLTDTHTDTDQTKHDAAHTAEGPLSDPAVPATDDNVTYLSQLLVDALVRVRIAPPRLPGVPLDEGLCSAVDSANSSVFTPSESHATLQELARLVARCATHSLTELLGELTCEDIDLRGHSANSDTTKRTQGTTHHQDTAHDQAQPAAIIQVLAQRLRVSVSLNLHFKDSGSSIFITLPAAIQVSGRRMELTVPPVAEYLHTFLGEYRREFGFLLHRAIVVEDVQVRCSWPGASQQASSEQKIAQQTPGRLRFSGYQPVYLGGGGGNPQPSSHNTTNSDTTDPPHHGMSEVPVFTVDLPGGSCARKMVRELPGGCDLVTGPALLVNSNTTVMVEPGWQAFIRHSDGSVVLHLPRGGADCKSPSPPTEDQGSPSLQAAGEKVPDSVEVDGRPRTIGGQRPDITHTESQGDPGSQGSQLGEVRCDSVLLSVYAHRFMSIAEQMGKTLQRTAVSVNIKERLDFSCALFGPRGGLVANAPHLPVHLGAMQEAVRYQINIMNQRTPQDRWLPGDVVLTNHPHAGGSHLPDITVITPVFAAHATTSPQGQDQGQGQGQGGAGLDGQRMPRPLFFVASRGHHSDIGGTRPGSLPPFSKFLCEEGVAIKSAWLVRGGTFQTAAVTHLLTQGASSTAMDQVNLPEEQRRLCRGTRNLSNNLSDLRAQVAANQSGIRLLHSLMAQDGLATVMSYMQFIQDAAADAVRDMLRDTYNTLAPSANGAQSDGIPTSCSASDRTSLDQASSAANTSSDSAVGGAGGPLTLRASDYMDDGTRVALAVCITPPWHPEGSGRWQAAFDFSGTGANVLGNWNAPPAITKSAVIYSLKCLVGNSVDIPLNQGCLEPVEITIPKNSLLNPWEALGVVGGNVLTSQRVTDVVLKAFRACAASQGCMNNLTMGDSSFGYYETVGGGAGAGNGWHGTCGVQVHMTNTKGTDPEILERRYPVMCTRQQLRPDSGGHGCWRGGDGIARELLFLRPLHFGILSERRSYRPFGLAGGGAGQPGQNLLLKWTGQEERKDSLEGQQGGSRGGREERVISLGGKATYDMQPGDRFRLLTPGGGGYGYADVEKQNGSK